MAQRQRHERDRIVDALPVATAWRARPGAVPGPVAMTFSERFLVRPGSSVDLIAIDAMAPGELGRA
jgi:hypothetical protein